MTCEHVTLPGGGGAIVCSARRRQRCACGRPANRLCDWKVQARKSGTCDAPICAGCAVHASADKDICPTHAPAFHHWQATRAAGGRA